MAEGEGASTGQNSRPRDDTVAETGPGIPDDAVLEGELAPGELDQGAETAVEALQRSGWVKPSEDAEGDAEAEAEAHPS